jgi:hypothetical protein
LRVSNRVVTGVLRFFGISVRLILEFSYRSEDTCQNRSILRCWALLRP